MRYFIYDSPEFRRYLEGSSHVRGEVGFLRSTARRGDVAIDVGGNVGVTTVTMAKAVGEEGRVYTFEPDPGNLEVLRRNLTINRLRNVRVFQMAVVDRVGEVEFYGGTVVPEEGSEAASVRATSLDAFFSEEGLGKVDLINIDCEGSELMVLKGAERLLRENDVGIFCELHHSLLGKLGQSVRDIVGYLRALGFEVYGVSLEDLSLDEEVGEPEYIFAVKG